MRPFVNEFLLSMAEKFHVAMWTSTMPDITAAWEEYIFRDVPLVFRWYYNKCLPQRKGVRKQLDRVWKAYPQFNITNTVYLNNGTLTFRTCVA